MRARALALAALFLAPTAAGAGSVSFAIDLVGGIAPASQQTIRVEQDDVVTVRIASDVAGELHLHGYNLEARLAPGAPVVLTFRARATGRYRFDWHSADGTTAKAGHAHRQAPVTLEVRPR